MLLTITPTFDDGVQLVVPEVEYSECALAWPYWQTVGLLSTCKIEERLFLQTLWGCTAVGGMTSLYIQSVNYQKRQELIYNIGGGGIGLNKMQVLNSPYLCMSCAPLEQLLALKKHSR